MELLLDHVPAGGRVLACDPERIRTRAHDLVATGEEFLAASWAAAAAGGVTPLDLGSSSAGRFGPLGFPAAFANSTQSKAFSIVRVTDFLNLAGIKKSKPQNLRLHAVHKRELGPPHFAVHREFCVRRFSEATGVFVRAGGV